MDESEQGRDLLSHNHASHDGQTVVHAPTRRSPQWYGYTAFVLSGGGARGALQVGAVRALLEAGIQPDVLIGTSIGAWNAAVLARFPFDEALERMTEAWRQSQPAQILLGRESGSSMPPHQALTGVLMLSAIRRVTQGYPSLYSDTGQKRLIADLLDDVTFEELRLPLRVIASDLDLRPAQDIRLWPGRASGARLVGDPRHLPAGADWRERLRGWRRARQHEPRARAEAGRATHLPAGCRL